MEGAGVTVRLMAGVLPGVDFGVGVVVIGLLLGANDHPYQWEYASFVFEPAIMWKWQTPGTTVEGKDIYELCEKLNVRAACEDTGIAGILNFAGADGWDLVGFWQRPMRSNAQRTVYWFKRPK